MDGARVVRAGVAVDELALLEHADDPRDAAEAQPRGAGQRGEVHLALVGRGEPGEQLEAAEAEAVLRGELGVERARELLVGLQQADPRVGVRLGPVGEALLVGLVRAAVDVVGWCSPAWLAEKQDSAKGCARNYLLSLR